MVDLENWPSTVYLGAFGNKLPWSIFNFTHEIKSANLQKKARFT